MPQATDVVLIPTANGLIAPPATRRPGQHLGGTPAGYLHAAYAGSLAEFGTPRQLPRCGGWILERQIPGTQYRDAVGPYPLFSCCDWSQLEEDVDELAGNLVSLTIVPAPFDGYDLALLERCFSHVIPFKPHYVTDLTQPIDKVVKRSHRDTVARATKKVQVSRCTEPESRLSQWIEFFGTLTQRHHITGMRAFSPQSFAAQLAVPGLVMFEARSGNEAVGLDLWYVQGDVAYGHLVAFNDVGYQLRASYATKWHLLHYFKDKVRWVDLGGGAGDNAQGTDGLSVFKQGWSTGTVPVYICGRVFAPDIYAELTRAAGVGATAYFPAYRAGQGL